MSSPSATQTALREIENRITSVEEKVKAIPELQKNFEKYVTHERFRPVEYIVYGLAGGVMLTVLTTLLAGVVSVKSAQPQARPEVNQMAPHAFIMQPMNDSGLPYIVKGIDNAK